MRVLVSIILVLLVAIAALVCIQTFDYPPDKWSYVIIAPKDEDLIRDLNEAGASGWEIVAARRATGGEGEKAAYELILKKRVGRILKSK